jgi:hypothetical protein
MTLRFVGKFFAKCFDTSNEMHEVSVVALASVVERLLDICGAGLVEDIRKVKQSYLRRIDAGTQSREAEAQLKLAAATNAANKATQVAHEEAMRAFTQEREAIRNRKLAADAAAADARADKANADAAQAKAKALRSLMDVYAEAKKKKLDAAERELLEALRQYRLEGGRVYIDRENLKALLKLTRSCPETRRREDAHVIGAIETFEILTQSQPQDYQSLEILKEAYLKAGREHDAIKTSKRIAQAYILAGQLGSAIQAYEWVLQRCASDAEALAALARLKAKPAV